MDKVDYVYKDQIIRALSLGSVSELMILVHSLTKEEAAGYIQKWHDIQYEVRELNKIGNNSEKINELNTEICNIPYELLDRANLSDYHR